MTDIPVPPEQSSSPRYPETLPHGPYLDKYFPDVYRALNAASATLRTVYPEVDLPDALIELVSVRASQLNGCPACLSIHIPKALRVGVPQATIDVLAAWRETDRFSPAERAALELTEAITLLPAGERHADTPLKALEIFAEEQVAALEWAVIMINTYNRLSIFSGHPPLPDR